MTIADLLGSIVGGGMTTLLGLGLLPLAIGAIAWALNASGRRAASQSVANLGIALGFGAVLALVCAMIGLRGHGLGALRIEWVLAPAYLLGAALAVEHVLHPGQQASIRGRVRSAALLLIVFAVGYWLLSTMRVYMLVHTGILGLLLFLAALVALGYVMVRRVV